MTNSYIKNTYAKRPAGIGSFATETLNLTSVWALYMSNLFKSI